MKENLPCCPNSLGLSSDCTLCVLHDKHTGLRLLLTSERESAPSQKFLPMWYWCDVFTHPLWWLCDRHLLNKLDWSETFVQHLTWKRMTAPSFIALSPTQYKSYRKSSGEAQRKESLKQPSTHSPLPERTRLSWMRAKRSLKRGNKHPRKENQGRQSRGREVQGGPRGWGVGYGVQRTKHKKARDL